MRHLLKITILLSMTTGGCGFGSQFTAAELRAKFSGLSLDLTEKQVEQRLGKPSKVTKDKHVVWAYYGKRADTLLVRFTNGNLSGASLTIDEKLQVMNKAPIGAEPTPLQSKTNAK
jgi:hypothetical protein